MQFEQLGSQVFSRRLILNNKGVKTGDKSEFLIGGEGKMWHNFNVISFNLYCLKL